MTCLIYNQSEDSNQYDPIIQHTILTSLWHLQEPHGEIAVILTSPKYIRKLNAQYRGIDAPTDVLSFPVTSSPPIGDIFINVERAQSQAQTLNQSVGREILFLVIHGLLHIIGYDHTTFEQERQMIAKQEELVLLCIQEWRKQYDSTTV